MKNKTISILIPDAENDLSLKVLRCLAQVSSLNLKISVLSRDKWSPIRLSKHHSGFFTHTIDGYDEKRLNTILDLAKKLKVDIILPIDLPTIRLLAAHQEEVKAIAALPPIASPEYIDIAADKWLLTDILKKEEIPYPTSLLFRSEQPEEHNFEELTYPVLTKPLDSAGGTGIIFFNNFADLSAYLKNDDHPSRLVIQSFIRGYDLGCSVLCQNGEIKAFTMQKGIIPGNKRFEPPSSIVFIQDEKIHENIEKLMRALNWSGVANIDLRYDEDKQEGKILEINPRYWGSVVGSMVAGINFPELACKLSLNIDFPKPEYQLVNYTKPESAVKLLLKKYFKGDNTVQSIKNTGLPYTLSDLGPEFIKYTAKIFERFTDN
ncbi:MAG: ATP-grasp domain-containing protein [Anaerolineales bacterium]